MNSYYFFVQNNSKGAKNMLLTFLRTIFLYIIVLVVMRFMGKREIG